MNTAPKTVFCDIDGTLLLHKGDIVKNITEEPVILEKVIDTIKQWEKLNYKIILTTGRKECTRKQTEQQLCELTIVYDSLIMGITNGNRIIINDKKTNGVENTCYAINLVRNKGFENIDLTSQNVTVPDNFLLSKIEKPWGYEIWLVINEFYPILRYYLQ